MLIVCYMRKLSNLTNAHILTISMNTYGHTIPTQQPQQIANWKSLCSLTATNNQTVDLFFLTSVIEWLFLKLKEIIKQALQIVTSPLQSLPTTALAKWNIFLKPSKQKPGAQI